MDVFTRAQFVEWGRAGGHKSRRKLSKRQARRLQRASVVARLARKVASHG